MFQKHSSHPVRNRVLAAAFAVIAAVGTIVSAAANEPDQSRVHPPAGDGWQLLAAPSTAAPALTVTAPVAASEAPAAGGVASHSATPPMTVAAVVLPSGKDPAPANLTFRITPQDTNLRNALDRWLQQQGWQLAWRIDDDLPLEFNATFSGDVTSILRQVMLATNNMRTPARVCRHTNNVIRVIARAASCKE
jgi:hypothetical protein